MTNIPMEGLRSRRSLTSTLGGLSLVLILITLGCSRFDSGTNGVESSSSATPNRTCGVPGVASEISAALCAGDANQLSQSVGDVMRKTVLYDRAVLALLERVWRGDRTLGQNLPWNRLQAADVQIVVANVLAQAVRHNAWSRDLRPMQELALRESRRSLATSGFAGIALLGYSNAPNQVSFLTAVSETSHDPAQISEAISALGWLCAGEADQALMDIKTKGTTDRRSQEWVDEALVNRSHRDSSFCRTNAH